MRLLEIGKLLSRFGFNKERGFELILYDFSVYFLFINVKLFLLLILSLAARVLHLCNLFTTLFFLGNALISGDEISSLFFPLFSSGES